MCKNKDQMDMNLSSDDSTVTDEDKGNNKRGNSEKNNTIVEKSKFHGFVSELEFFPVIDALTGFFNSSSCSSCAACFCISFFPASAAAAGFLKSHSCKCEVLLTFAPFFHQCSSDGWTRAFLH